MLKARLFDFSLFFAAIAIALATGTIETDLNTFLKALVIYWFFSNLYEHLRVSTKYANVQFDKGISYSLSLALFSGLFGLFIYETIRAFTVYINRKRTKTADSGEFLDTFYNIGSTVVANAIAYYFFQLFYPSVQDAPFGFFLLFFLSTCISYILLTTFLITVFVIIGELKSFKEAFNFFTNSRSVLDFVTTAIVNGLLLLFLQGGKWEMLISLFILNYVVSLSAYSKAQNIKNKTERDKFEQMAYTDFLTGVYNRAFMDKKMTELNQSGEAIGIVVSDIDKFKKINDNFNHAIGDRVIQHFATTINNHMQNKDILIRSGGEEFTFFLRNRDFEHVVELVRDIQKDVEESKVNVHFNENDITVSYTASFGVYYFNPDTITPMEKGYVNADQLLLKSKQLGRNLVSVNRQQDKEKELVKS